MLINFLADSRLAKNFTCEGLINPDQSTKRTTPQPWGPTRQRRLHRLAEDLGTPRRPLRRYIILDEARTGAAPAHPPVPTFATTRSAAMDSASDYEVQYTLDTGMDDKHEKTSSRGSKR
jgi:hypothetical protein